MRSIGRSRLLALVGIVYLHVLVDSTSSRGTKQTVDKVWLKSEQVFGEGALANVTVRCGGDAPVHHCQFLWFDNEHTGYDLPTVPLVSLSVQDNPEHQLANNHTTGLNVTGRIDYDGCELTMRYERFTDTVVGCRLSGQRGEWKYGFIDVYADERGLLPVDISSPGARVVLPGEDVTLMCNTTVPLEGCRISTPGQGGWLDFDGGAASNDSTGRYRYRGLGLERGECGITVTNVTYDDHGRYRCLVTTATARVHKGIEFVVAIPPANTPVVQLEQFPTNTTALKATCSYGISWPKGNVTWMLDDEIYNMTSHDDSASDPNEYWTWPWFELGHNESTVLMVEPMDEGKQLRCVVSHVALDQPLESVVVEISLDDPLLETEFIINYERGATLKATCRTEESRLEANLTWLLGDRIVRQDGINDGLHDNNGRFVSQTLYLRLKAQDNGKMLKCVASHPALVRPIEKSVRLWYKPFDPLLVSMEDEVVVLPGKDANLSCVTLSMNQKYLPRIETCSFKLLGREESAYFYRSDQPRVDRPGYRFNGGPVELGGCAITLERVTEADNGRVLCRIESDTAILFRRYIMVVVAHLPSAPVLRVDYSGPLLKATCSVGSGRPVAKIAWMLGDEIIRQEPGDDSPVYDEDYYSSAEFEDHSPPNNVCRSPLVDASITQTIAWRLEPEDNGKLLRCVMSHPGIDRPIEDAHEIVF